MNNFLSIFLYRPYEWNSHEKPVGGKSKFRLWGHVIPMTWQLLNRKPFNVLQGQKSEVRYTML